MELDDEVWKDADRGCDDNKNGEVMRAAREQASRDVMDIDESTHQILSYGLLFSTFYHFPYTADPLTSTTLT